MEGSDDGDGSATQPFRSPQRLVDSLRPGETGCLRGGVYRADGDYVVSFARGGGAGAPITLRSAPGERAALAGTVMVPSGRDHVVLRDLDIEGDGTKNAIKVYAADTVVANNVITTRGRPYSCLVLGSEEAGMARRPSVRRNFFHDCGDPARDNKDHAIYASWVVDALIAENVFSNAAGKTIQLYPNARRTRVVQNVIDGGPDTVRGGIVIGGGATAASSDNVIERNVIAHAADYGVYAHWEGPVGTGNVVRRNCVWAAGVAAIDEPDGFRATDNLEADPGFADRGERDYRLEPDSPCLTHVGGDLAKTVPGAWRR